MQPSDGDYAILECFKQRNAVIYNSKGDFRTFEKGVDNMCKLFIAYEKQIKEYCISNNIDFDKVKNLPQCWGKNDIWLQYYDPEKGKQGLNDETPAPIVLKIYVDNGNVTIEQTEYTKKYLS